MTVMSMMIGDVTMYRLMMILNNDVYVHGG